MIPLPDYSHLPTHPWPWLSLPRTCGYSINGYACFPKDKRQASEWAGKDLKSGCRVIRAHKVDTALRDNPGAHIPRYKLFKSEHQKRGIPFFEEVLGNRPLEEFGDALDLLSRCGWENVVALTPVNEPQVEYDYEECVTKIRRTGFTGLVFNSNSVKQGGRPGDLLDGHIYCGLEFPKEGEYLETYYADESYNHPSQIDVATETGHPPYASTRGVSEEQIHHQIDRTGCKCFFMFAFLDDPKLWAVVNQTPNQD